MCNGLSDIITKQEILKKTNCVCAHCGKELNLKTFTIDHYIPRSKGGTDSINNLIPLCEPCNRSKSNIILNPEEAYKHINIKHINKLWKLYDDWTDEHIGENLKIYFMISDTLLKFSLSDPIDFEDEDYVLNVGRSQYLNEYHNKGIDEGYNNILLKTYRKKLYEIYSDDNYIISYMFVRHEDRPDIKPLREAYNKLIENRCETTLQINNINIKNIIQDN